MRKIIILNYGLSCVDVVHIPAECQLTEDVEQALMDMGFKMSQISWMSADDGGEIPVFYDNEECPVCVL